MPDAIRLEVLPARLGDCLLVECLREGRTPWRMLVDGGPPDTWPLLRARLERLPQQDRQLDAVVVTHIDSDHIGGIIPLLDSDFARANVRDVWFNGRPHLPRRGAGARSFGQGESVAAQLTGATTGPVLPWNEAFDHGAVGGGDTGAATEVTITDGPRITVLSPTDKQLAKLGAAWWEAVEAAQRGTRGELEPDSPAPLTDLAGLAAQRTPKDSSTPNGSSIALLVEHRGASVLLAGDAFGTVLAAGLSAVAAARSLPALTLDAVKLPHHGSSGNVLAPLLAAAPASHYLVSSNGDTFHHPDDEAIARVVLGAPRGATLWFNYRTLRTERWADPALCAEYGYAARYPDGPTAGIELVLPARAPGHLGTAEERQRDALD